MVPTLVCMVLFGGYGAWRAKQSGGKLPDILQYAGSFAIFGMIVGVIAAIILSRLV
ncbi:MAG: hypothetical protein AAFP13_00615 [Pseudomonadota bacterium]